MNEVKKTKYRTFDEVYENYEGRNNILIALSIKKGSNILYLGNNKAHIRFLSNLGNLCICNGIDQLTSITESFDTIIADRFFDSIVWNQKIDFLLKLLTLKKESGHIYIFANNKLAIRYFSGTREEESSLPYGNLVVSNHLLSFREWERLIKSTGEEFKFYFPYPDLDFTNTIYTNDPKLGQIQSVETLFKDYRLMMFNDVQALNEINKSGYFKDFSNCFLIEIGSPSNVEMIKFSLERKPEFQMMTSILKNGTERSVEKKCICNAGIKHLDKIEEYYHRFNKYNQNLNIAYCPLKRKSQDTLEFKYITGENLEEKIELAVMKRDRSKIESYLKIIDELASVGERSPFKPNQRFYDVFGKRNYSLLENQECYDIANIDLIFGNVICNNKYYAIDYEWVFDCTIPKSYILFRTLLHSYALSKLEPSDLEALYELCGINEQLKDIFMEMEYSFQDYVSHLKISDIQKEYHLLKLFPYDLEQRIRKIELIQGEDKHTYYFDNGPSFNETFDIVPGIDVKLLIHGKSILGIHQLTVDGKAVSFTTNADLIDGNNYYFLNDPEICICAPAGNQLDIDGYFYLFNDGNIDRIVELMNLIGELAGQNHALQKHLDSLLSHRIVRLLDRKKK